ncbi:hypothetical protein [Bacillus alkalicola]|uniref:hypothetical protein n=1 Tax=Bacillaceae TaxID=186817 RepID=UPI003AA9DC4E
MNKQQVWLTLSIVCLLIGMAAWIPNIILEQASSFWLLTFVVNPIGALLGYFGKSKAAIILNIIMACSFFLVMFFGYFFAAITGGQP